jgi:hypothetical protein
MMESKYHVGTRSTLRCKLKRKQRPPAVGRYLYALTKPRGDAALESGLAAAEGRVLCAEALNVSLDNLVSAFNVSSYIGDCSDLQEDTDADEFQFISYDSELTPELIKTAWELYGKFNTFIQTALWFFCTENITVGHDVIPMARIYAHNFTEFVVRLNGSTAAIGEVAVFDTVADLYRTSIEHVESVRELVEQLTEMISVENKIDE